MDPVRLDLVIPTIGRASLALLLNSLSNAAGPLPERIILVDDRRDQGAGALAVDALSPRLRARLEIVRSGGRGPAAARNAGWRRATAAWTAFLDDDVIVGSHWFADLQADLQIVPARAAGSQGNVDVPLPNDRRPTDWERNTRALERAHWITADCAYRLDVLRALDGFDERFPRAFREDAEFALRVLGAGRTLARGHRRITHPVRPADAWVSVRVQAGNADDALMNALHGSDWYERANAERGNFHEHVTTVAVAAGALALGLWWTGRTADFALRRIAPGPRTPVEIANMTVTSAIIPFAAVKHRALGMLKAIGARAKRPATRAVLFDRDGTLIEDVPNNADPGNVRLLPGAKQAVSRLRAAGIAVGVVTNQPSVGEGRVTREELERVHARMEHELGGLDCLAVCMHGTQAGCDCRKPLPGLIFDAARRLGVDPAQCVVVGDIGTDIDAALAAGARAVLVPTGVTLREEIIAAPVVADDLISAATMILRGAV